MGRRIRHRAAHPASGGASGMGRRIRHRAATRRGAGRGAVVPQNFNRFILEQLQKEAAGTR
jgi:hypothetical protein